MNLDYVLIGSDENPDYLDFWPIVSKVWKEKFNIIPVLGLISDEESDLIPDEFGLVKKFKKVDGIPDGLLSQIVRLYLPKYLQGKCIVSDIDMIPLSKEYFYKNSTQLNDENIIIYSSDNPECLMEKMYPMCYISAHSNIFNKVFIGNLEWELFSQKLYDRNEGWYTDQKFIFEKINQYFKETKNCIFLYRGWNGPANRRIDRINWSYSPEKVKEGYYIDSHSLRPYKQYSSEIDNLINLI